MFIVALGAFALLLIDINIRLSAKAEGKELIHEMLIPLGVFFGLFVDKYVTEIWRFEDNLERFSHRYIDYDQFYHIPALLYILVILFGDLET